MRPRLAVALMVVALASVAFPASAGAGNPWVRLAAARPSDRLNVLTRVRCTSTTECTAVGYYLRTDGVQPFVMHTRFGVWKREVIDAPSFFTQLRDVSCTAATTCTAVGSYAVPQENYRSRTLVLRTSNGKDWDQVPTPSLGGASSTLNGISCVSATRCRAVGARADRSLVLRTSNGVEWFREPSPNRGTGDNELFSIDCTNNATCTAVGSYRALPGSVRGRTLVMRTVGGPPWSLVPSPNPSLSHSSSTLSDVSCVAPTTCVAVGPLSPAPAGVEQAFILRTTDGSTWTRSTTPTATGEVELDGVDCTSAIACTAVGVRFDADKTHITGQILRTTDGTSWSSPSPSSERLGRGLIGVSCVTDTACFGVGAFNDTGSLEDPFRTLLLKET